MSKTFFMNLIHLQATISLFKDKNAEIKNRSSNKEENVRSDRRLFFSRSCQKRKNQGRKICYLCKDLNHNIFYLCNYSFKICFALRNTTFIFNCCIAISFI